MNSGRQTLTELLSDLPAGWGLLDHGRELDHVTRPTLITWTSDVNRLETNGFSYLKWAVETWITVPAGPDTAKTEDALDAALLVYLHLLESIPQVTWDTATRGVLADTLDGYRIVVTVIQRID